MVGSSETRGASGRVSGGGTREDIRREDSDWLCVHCGRRFFREKDARVHVFTKHRKKTGKADRGASIG